MKTTTIKKLNQINKDFYQNIAQSFSDSRKYSWQGWQQLLPVLENYLEHKQEFSILDIGCGNGRFAFFLQENFPNKKIHYYGIDNNPQLLAIASQKLQTKNIQPTLLEIDLVETLIENSFSQQLTAKTDSNSFDLIVAFGLMHHLPSSQLRNQFIETIKDISTDETLNILTFWQFKKSERFLKKQIDPDQVEVNQNELEQKDYFLDWQRGSTAYRYCHFFDDREIEELIADNGLEVIDQFSADGKENKLNKYLLFCSKDNRR